MCIEKSSESEPVDFEPLSEKGWYQSARLISSVSLTSKTKTHFFLELSNLDGQLQMDEFPVRIIFKQY